MNNDTGRRLMGVDLASGKDHSVVVVVKECDWCGKPMCGKDRFCSRDCELKDQYNGD